MPHILSLFPESSGIHDVLFLFVGTHIQGCIVIYAVCLMYTTQVSVATDLRLSPPRLTKNNTVTSVKVCVILNIESHVSQGLISLVQAPKIHRETVPV